VPHYSGKTHSRRWTYDKIEGRRIDNRPRAAQTTRPFRGAEVAVKNLESILANTKSAEKPPTSAQAPRHNVAARSKLRTAIRDVTLAISSGTKTMRRAVQRGGAR